MKIRHVMATAAAVIAAGVLPLAPAKADSILYDTMSVIAGAQSSVESFNITAPGTLTVTLAAIPWFDTLSNMSVFFSTASSVIPGSSMGAGTESLNVSAGTVYSHFFGNANGSYGLGAYGMKVSFQASAGGTPVPLPASLLLLLSGLGILFGWQRRERSAVQAEWA
jgi:hypothetical protein